MECLCVDRLPQGDRVTVFGDRESGALRPQEKHRPVRTLCLSFTEEIQTMNVCVSHSLRSFHLLFGPKTSKQLLHHGVINTEHGGWGGRTTQQL